MGLVRAITCSSIIEGEGECYALLHLFDSFLRNHFNFRSGSLTLDGAFEIAEASFQILKCIGNQTGMIAGDFAVLD